MWLKVSYKGEEYDREREKEGERWQKQPGFLLTFCVSIHTPLFRFPRVFPAARSLRVVTSLLYPEHRRAEGTPAHSVFVCLRIYRSMSGSLLAFHPISVRTDSFWTSPSVSHYLRVYL